MLKILLLLTNLLQFYPQDMGVGAVLPIEGLIGVQTTEFSVEFTDSDRHALQNLEVGSPVLFGGQLIGQLSEIQLREGRAVVLLRSSLLPQLRQGTVALLSSRLSQDKRYSQRFIELLSPEFTGRINDKAVIRGFSSFQRFWNADLETLSWIDQSNLLESS